MTKVVIIDLQLISSEFQFLASDKTEAFKINIYYLYFFVKKKTKKRLAGIVLSSLGLCELIWI